MKDNSEGLVGMVRRMFGETHAQLTQETQETLSEQAQHESGLRDAMRAKRDAQARSLRRELIAREVASTLERLQR